MMDRQLFTGRLYRVSLKGMDDLYVIANTMSEALHMVELSGKNRKLLTLMEAAERYYTRCLAPSVAEVTGIQLVAEASNLVFDFGNVMEQPAEQGE